MKQLLMGFCIGIVVFSYADDIKTGMQPTPNENITAIKELINYGQQAKESPKIAISGY